MVAVSLLQAHHSTLVPRQVLGLHPGFWIVSVAATATVLSVFDYIVPNWGAVQSAMRDQDC